MCIPVREFRQIFFRPCAGQDGNRLLKLRATPSDVKRDLLSEDVLKNCCHQLTRMLDRLAVCGEYDVARLQARGLGGSMGHDI